MDNLPGKNWQRRSEIRHLTSTMCSETYTRLGTGAPASNYLAIACMT
jgi:hypothetical protein